MTCLPAIPGSPFLDTQDFLPSYDDVINHGDPDHFGRLFKSFGDTDVLINGSGIAAGMVVQHQYAVGGSITAESSSTTDGAETAAGSRSECEAWLKTSSASWSWA